MNELQESNRRILFNLLPAHVATHFLDNQFRSNMVIILILLLMDSSFISLSLSLSSRLLPGRTWHVTRGTPEAWMHNARLASSLSPN